jgi:hypothetical protein
VHDRQAMTTSQKWRSRCVENLYFAEEGRITPEARSEMQWQHWLLVIFYKAIGNCPHLPLSWQQLPGGPIENHKLRDSTVDWATATALKHRRKDGVPKEDYYLCNFNQGISWNIAIFGLCSKEKGTPRSAVHIPEKRVCRMYKLRDAGRPLAAKSRAHSRTR